MDVLLLDVTGFSDEAHWSWRLTAGDGEVLASHEVQLDTAAAEYEGFTDLYGYLHWHAAPDRARADKSRLVAGVGRWIGAHVFGEVAAVIAACAAAAPVVVRVRVPDEARVLFTRPLELAYVDDRPLALHDVSLVLEPAGQGTPPPGGSVPVEGRLRILAIFSLPDSEQALGLRWERHRLEHLIRKTGESGQTEVDLRVVQYGVTRDRLRDVLGEPEGWDIVHISGHGLPGGLLLERDDGRPHLIGTRRLIELLDLSRPRLKLVTLTSCESAAATATTVSLAHLGLARSAAAWPVNAPGPAALDDAPAQSAAASTGIGNETAVAPAEVPGDPGLAREEVPLPTLASRVARQVGCAVLAMRYRVSDEFAMMLTESLYRYLLRDRNPLPRALQRVLAEWAPTAPPLSVAAPALFGSPAATLQFPAPKSPMAAVLRPVRAGGLAEVPPEPERFVGRIGVMRRASAALAPANTFRGIVLHGMPGVGKTACALELAHTHEHAFRHVLWYTVPEDVPDYRDALRAFLSYLSYRDDSLPLISCAQAPGETEEAFRQELPRLSEAFARQSLLLVVDRADALLTEDGQWRDDHWGVLIHALVTHDGPSRVIITSRRSPPPPDDKMLFEPVYPLSQLEGGMAGLQFDEFRALLIGAAGIEHAEGAQLFDRTLLAVQGHPQLIEVASRIVSPLQVLRQRLDEADRAWADNRTPMTSFLLKGADTAAGDCLRAIESWTVAVRRALPENAAMLLDMLCGLEEADCGDFGGKWTWGQVQERLGMPSNGAEFEDVLAVLQRAALVEVLPSEEGRFRVFRIHPAVAGADRAAAPAALLAAVDSEMAVFLHSFYLHTLKLEPRQQGTMVRMMGQRAVPYLLRAGRLGDASDVLMALLYRDQSQEAVEEILPLLRRVAAGAVGTGYELQQRAYAARAESFIHPVAAEAELRDLLRQAEDSNRPGLAWSIAGDLTRVTRDTGRLDEAIAFADKSAALARASQAGPWAELASEITRLQIQLQRGEAEQVLDRTREMATLITTLPEPEPDDDPGSWDTHQTWNTRETILHTAMLAAGDLARWEEMLAFSEQVTASMAGRDASPFEQAAAALASYQALIGLGRLEEARDLLRHCRDVFSQHRDAGLTGKAIGALGNVETLLGHHDTALRLHQDGLRLQYAAADLPGIHVGHLNVASALRRTSGNPSTAIAHDLAAALISHKAGLAGQEEAVTALARQLGHLPDPPAAALSFAALRQAVGAADGVDLAGLIAGIWPGDSGDTIVAEVLSAIRSVPLDPRDPDQDYRDWEPVLAALLAAEHGDERAAGWLDRRLLERGTQTRWVMLASVLRDIRRGERDPAILHYLQPAEAAIARRALDALAGTVDLAPAAGSAWTILDYADDWEPVIQMIASAAYGNPLAAARSEQVFGKFREEWDTLKTILCRIVAGERGQQLLAGLNRHDTLITERVLGKIAATAQPLTVSAQGGANYSTISAAIKAAEPWGRIIVKAGTYSESLAIIYSVDITGEDAVQLCSKDGPCVAVIAAGAAAALRNINMTVEDTAEHAVIDHREGQLYLDHCSIAGSADCIYACGKGVQISLRDCEIKNGNIGLLIDEGSSADLRNCTISGNAALQVVVCDDATVALRDCRIHDGKNVGVGLWKGGGGTFEDCEIYGNGQDGEPGILIGDAGPASFRGCRIFKNSSGVRFEGGTADFDHCDVYDNGRNGVFVKSGGKPRMRDCRIRNSEWDGIIICDDSSGEFTDCDIHDNLQHNIIIKRDGDPVFRECRIFDAPGRITRGSLTSAVMIEGGLGRFENCEVCQITGLAFKVASGDPLLLHCKIYDNTGDGMLFTSHLGASYGRFGDCDIYGNHGRAIAIAPACDPAFERCRIHHNGEAGVWAGQGAQGIFYDCDITDNHTSDLSLERPSYTVFENNGRKKTPGNRRRWGLR